MTSLDSIVASSPSKTNWTSRRTSANILSRVKNACSGILPQQKKVHDSGQADLRRASIISDSISDSRHLQHSIMVVTENKGEHVVHCCKKNEAENVIRTLQWKATKEINEGRLQTALHNLNESLALQQKLYGERDLKVASTLNRMGEVLSKMGEDYRYMAMSAFEESLAIRQEAEPGSEETAATLMNLWLLLHESNSELKTVKKVESSDTQDTELM